MTRNQTAIASANTSNTVIINHNDTNNTVIYPSMFDRWKLPL